MNLMAGLSGLAGFGQSFSDSADRAAKLDLMRQEMEMRRLQMQQQAAAQDRAQVQDMNDRQAISSVIDPMRAAESSGMGNRDMARRQNLPSVGIQKMIWEMGQKEDPTYQFQTLADGVYAVNPKNPQDMRKVGDAKAEGIMGEFMSVVGRKPQNMNEVLGFIRQKAQAGHIREPKTPNFDIFIGPDGNAKYIPKGSDIPTGFTPSSAGGININTGALPTEKAKMVTLADDGSNSFNAIVSALFDPTTGELDRQTATLVRMPGAREGTYGPKVSMVRAALDNAIRAKLRLESGAAIGENEQAAEDAKYIPGIMDDTATAMSKLAPLGAVLKGYVKNSTGKDGKEPAQNQTIAPPAGFTVIP